MTHRNGLYDRIQGLLVIFYLISAAITDWCITILCCKPSGLEHTTNNIGQDLLLTYLTAATVNLVIMVLVPLNAEVLPTETFYNAHLYVKRRSSIWHIDKQFKSLYVPIGQGIFGVFFFFGGGGGGGGGICLS